MSMQQVSKEDKKIQSYDTRFVFNHYVQFLELHDDIPVAEAAKIKRQLIHGSTFFYIWVSEKWKLLYKVTGLKIFFFFKTGSILCKIFWGKLKNQAKFDSTKRLWYLFKGIFGGPVHKIYFYRTHRTLGCVPMQFGDFLNIAVPT